MNLNSAQLYYPCGVLLAGGSFGEDQHEDGVVLHKACGALGVEKEVGDLSSGGQCRMGF
ncbi:hypothetical protein Tco_0376946, partial [Tanacetum coccineum]